MPDHVHLQVVLGEGADLSGLVRRFNGGLSPDLRRHGSQWERGYFDHRMRHDEDRLPLFLYILLNPYRAKLLPVGERWPGYRCSDDDWKWFGEMTNAACPFAEWLG